MLLTVRQKFDIGWWRTTVGATDEGVTAAIALICFNTGQKIETWGVVGCRATILQRGARVSWSR
jgi:hypothetical protein